MADADDWRMSPAPAAVPTPVPAPAHGAAAVPACTPAADSYAMLTDRLDELERSFEARVKQVEEDFQNLVVEQGQWIEAGIQEPLKQLWDRVALLMRRTSNLEQYLGLQGGAQTIVLFNGQSNQRVTRIERESIRGETIEPMPNAEADANTDAGLKEGMELIEEIEVAEEGGRRQDIEDQVAVQPLVNAGANANANGEAEGMEGVESEEVNSGMVKENVEDGQKSQQVEAESAVFEEGGLGPEPADADDVIGAVPGIYIIPAMPQDSQEMPQRPMTVAPPLPPLITPTSVPEATAVTAATPASAVTSIASPHPSPPRTQVRRSPRLRSPGPSVIPSTNPPPQPQLSTLPHPSPAPAQLRRSPRDLTPGPAGLHSRSPTPQPNPKKRVGTSEDRGATKRGRKE